MAKKIKLLIINDLCLFLDGLKALLSSYHDFEILNCFQNSKDILACVEKNQPDLILIDISIEQMNGLELIYRVKKTNPTQKILILSNHPNLVKLANVDGYFHKSFGINDLVRIIKSIVLENKKCFLTIEKNKESLLELNCCILTKRESQIVQLISQEKLVPEIANTLMISKHTVESHKKNIYRKLQVNSLSGLIKKSIFLGYVN